MAQVSGQGTVWNLPDYHGDLFTADAVNTPLLNLLGGITSGMKTDNFEFAVSSEYDFPAAAQPAITETTSLTAPTAIEAVRTQVKNVTQIFHEAVSISYAKLTSKGRLSGINTKGMSSEVPSEMDFQIAYALQHIARDVEFTFINGAYQIATAANVANKTRGLFACATAGSNEVAAGTAALTKDMVEELLRTMYGNGAMFRLPVFMVNAFQKQSLSALYGYAPQDRNIGGVDIRSIETDFGLIPVVLNRFVPTDDILLADLSVLQPVFGETPNRGYLFYEPLSKTGASENGQIYGEIGLDHGPYWMHGSITDLATS